MKSPLQIFGSLISFHILLILHPFISFQIILCHFDSFHVILCHFKSFYAISNHFMSFHIISGHFISFHIVSISLTLSDLMEPWETILFDLCQAHNVTIVPVPFASIHWRYSWWINWDISLVRQILKQGGFISINMIQYWMCGDVTWRKWNSDIHQDQAGTSHIQFF